jgi:hypothetical protein
VRGERQRRGARETDTEEEEKGEEEGIVLELWFRRDWEARRRG